MLLSIREAWRVLGPTASGQWQSFTGPVSHPTCALTWNIFRTTDNLQLSSSSAVIQSEGHRRDWWDSRKITLFRNPQVAGISHNVFFAIMRIWFQLTFIVIPYIEISSLKKKKKKRLDLGCWKWKTASWTIIFLAFTVYKHGLAVALIGMTSLHHLHYHLFKFLKIREQLNNLFHYGWLPYWVPETNFKISS